MDLENHCQREGSRRWWVNFDRYMSQSVESIQKLEAERSKLEGPIWPCWWQEAMYRCWTEREILRVKDSKSAWGRTCICPKKMPIFWPGLTRGYQSSQGMWTLRDTSAPTAEITNCPAKAAKLALAEVELWPLWIQGSWIPAIIRPIQQFPVVSNLTSTSSQATLTHLCIFAVHGIPVQLLTDNGKQYSSKEFRDFRESYGIEHLTSSPNYPQANGPSERMVQTLKNIVTKCDEDGWDPYLELLSYRAIPIDHKVTGKASNQ